MKHLVIGQHQKAPNFSTFYWSPLGSLVSIGQHFVTTRVVHQPKRTETSLITKSDQSGPNHQLLQLCTARTPSPNRTRLCGSCIAAKAGLNINYLQTLIIKSTRFSLFPFFSSNTSYKASMSIIRGLAQGLKSAINIADEVVQVTKWKSM